MIHKNYITVGYGTVIQLVVLMGKGQFPLDNCPPDNCLLDICHLEKLPSRTTVPWIFYHLGKLLLGQLPLGQLLLIQFPLRKITPR